MDRQFKTFILVHMILEVTLVSQTQDYISIWIGFSIHSGQNSPLSLYSTRWVALMIQLDVRVRTPRARKFVGGVGWLTPTTYIQLVGLDQYV